MQAIASAWPPSTVTSRLFARALRLLTEATATAPLAVAGSPTVAVSFRFQLFQIPVRPRLRVEEVPEFPAATLTKAPFVAGGVHSSLNVAVGLIESVVAAQGKVDHIRAELHGVFDGTDDVVAETTKLELAS